MQRIYGKADSGEWIEDRGLVTRLIADDAANGVGSRHQRFVVELRGRQTLLITHNLELAPRVPVGLGDRVSFRGMYEYNDSGGLVHWTHRDPMGAGYGGWIRCGRETYC